MSTKKPHRTDRLAGILGMTSALQMQKSLKRMYDSFIESDASDDRTTRVDVTTDYHLLVEMVQAVEE